MMKYLAHIIQRMCKCSFFRWDHLAVCGMIGLFGWLLLLISKVEIFNPVKAAFDDFSMTDVFFEIQRDSASAHFDDDIVIVDMTDLRTREEIAQAITDIKSCHPKVLGIDLIFERPSYDQYADSALISAIERGDCQQVFSCKLRDFDPDKESFKNCLYSFFDKRNDYVWGYTNYNLKRIGGVTRKTSQTQKLNDSISYSFPYLLACYYTGKQLKEEEVNERNIIYANVNFITLKSSEVLQHKEVLKNKLVLLGAKEEADTHFSPLGKMSGVQVIAYSILSYVKHNDICKMSRWTSLLLAFVLCYIAAWMGYKIQQWTPIFYSFLMKFFIFGLCAVVVGFSFYVFVKQDYYVDMLYPLIGLTLEESSRVLYAGIIRWFVRKKKIEILKSSIYA